MAVIEGGVSGSLQEVGVSPFIAAHVRSSPLAQSASLGAYRIAATTGTVAAALAANAQVFYLRWTDATRYFVLHRFKASFQALTLFTGATLTDFGFDLIRATAVSAGGGGTDLGALVKTRMRSTMSPSLLDTAGLMRISGTAALTALTTLDATSIAQSVGDPQRVNPAAGTEEQRVNDPTLLYEAKMSDGEYPLVLAQNEGLVFRNRTVWPAAGTGIFTIEMSWSEVSAF
jgi:hypothetical protein